MRDREHSLRKPDTETRLLWALAPKLSTLLGTVVQWTDLHVYPATGYWRQRRADVMQWTGVVEVNGYNQTLGCWESMTDCLRYGFEVHDMRGTSRSYADFEISAARPARG